MPGQIYSEYENNLVSIYHFPTQLSIRSERTHWVNQTTQFYFWMKKHYSVDRSIVLNLYSVSHVQ